MILNEAHNRLYFRILSIVIIVVTKYVRLTQQGTKSIKQAKECKELSKDYNNRAKDNNESEKGIKIRIRASKVKY